MRAALEEVSELTGDLATGPVVLCTDSQAALALIGSGAGIQTTPLGAAIWRLLSHLTARDQDVTLQWVPAHCGLPGNERADELAKEASSLPQEAPIDVRTVTKAVSRAAYRAWRHQWPDGFFKQIWGDRMPSPVLGEDRGAAVDTHQLRAGHWSRSRQYLHRIGCLPSPAGCPDKKCPAGFCIVCGEEADTPEHVMLWCPCLAGVRLREFGTICTEPAQLRDDRAVAALVRGYRRHTEPLADGRLRPSREE